MRLFPHRRCKILFPLPLDKTCPRRFIRQACSTVTGPQIYSDSLIRKLFSVTSRQIPLELGHRPALDRADLLVTAGNREAVSWIDSWPDWPSHAVALFGPEGCGKSHLVHVFAAKTRAEIITADDLASVTPIELAQEHKALAWDDAEAAADETSVFHLYNAVREAGGHLLICSRTPPARWPVTLPDLKSRLAAVPAVEILPPDDATLIALLAKLFRERQVGVSEDALTYIVNRIPRTFAAVQAVVGATDRAALGQGRKISVPLIRDVLAEMQL